MVIDGIISGVFCSDILVDSGSEVTVVHPKVVAENACVGRTILISGFRNKDNDFTECTVACEQIKVGGVCGYFEVAVCDGIGYSALLGRDLGWESLRSLVDLAITKKKEQKSGTNSLLNLWINVKSAREILYPPVQIVCLSSVRVSLMYVSRPLKLCLLGSRPRPKLNWSRLTKLLALNLEQLPFVLIKLILDNTYVKECLCRAAFT